MRTVAIGDIVCCPTADKRIIETSLNTFNGKFVLDNGLEFGTKPSEVELFEGYEFAERIRLFSMGAKMNWLDFGKPLWNTLNNVTHANFHGAFHQDFIEDIVSKCSNIKSLSFTYWSVFDFAAIVDKIQSSQLSEITVHVNGTTTNLDQTFKALKGLGDRVGCNLVKLMLIFDESLPSQLDLNEYTFRSFGRYLTPETDVCLLFQKEPDDMCMTTFLKSNGYDDWGSFCMAQNDPLYVDETEEKIYEYYKIFRKVDPKARFIIGCRKDLQSCFKILSKTSTNCTIDITGEANYPIFEEHDATESHISPMSLQSFEKWFGPKKFLSNTQVTSLPKKAVMNLKECCTFIKNTFYQDTFYQRAPVFFRSSLQKGTFHGNYRLEFLTMDGFYYAPSSYEVCQEFLQKMDGKAAPRFILSSSACLQNLCIPFSLEGFLSSCKSFELHGKWAVGPAYMALRQILNLQSLTLMRLFIGRFKQDSRLHTIQKILDALTINVRTGITSFSFDTRDMEENSLMDLFRAIRYNRYPFNALQKIVVITNIVSPLLIWVKAFVDTTAPDKTITVISCLKIPINEIEQLGVQGKMVIVPRIFSKRYDVASMNQLMNCYHFERDGRTFNLVVPID